MRCEPHAQFFGEGVVAISPPYPTNYGGNWPVVLVVPLTTARAAMRFAGTTLIRPTAEKRLRQASVAMVFQLRAIDRSRMQEHIGTVSTEVLNAIFEELGKLTGRSV
ncbi:MAG TPA: type II toxin-antitoxin system PemK/MazF family toxin [Candidatus Tectomicrobia bacterium]